MTTGSPEGPAPEGAGPSVRLERWQGSWEPDDPFASFKDEVADHTRLDPLETLRGLSEAAGIPVGALARYVLAKWACGGSEAILELGVSGVDHLARSIETAEAADTDEARLAAYEEIRGQVAWLRAGVEQHAQRDLAGGSEQHAQRDLAGGSEQHAQRDLAGGSEQHAQRDLAGGSESFSG